MTTTKTVRETAMAHQEMLAAAGIFESNGQANWASNFTALESQKRNVNAAFQPNRATRLAGMPSSSAASRGRRLRSFRLTQERHMWQVCR